MKMSLKELLGGASILAMSVAPAFAQDTGEVATINGAQSDEDQADVIVVEGYRRSLADSLASKRASPLVAEFIDLSDINSIPAISIADAIIKLPGITGSRDRGNNSQTVIRGLGPRLVLGLVNDRETASSEPSRNIRWEQYPSEIISGVQVFKSQSAELTAGGVAGTINLQTVSPLNYGGPSVSARFGGTFQPMASDIPNVGEWGMRGSGLIVHKFSDSFGVALGGSYHDQKNGFERFQGWGYTGSDVAAGFLDNAECGGGLGAGGCYAPNAFTDPGSDTILGTPDDISLGLDGLGTTAQIPWGGQVESRGTSTERVSLLGTAEWAPTDRTRIRFDALYAEFEISENTTQTWVGGIGDPLFNDVTSPTFSNLNVIPGIYGALAVGGVGFVDPDNPFHGGGTIRQVPQRYDQSNSVFNSGLNIKHEFNESWEVEADVAFSQAERFNLWNAIYLDYNPSGDPFLARTDISWDMGDFENPSFTAAGGVNDPNNLVVDAFDIPNAEGSHLKDEIWSYKGDITRKFGEEGVTEIKVGARYTDRSKAVQWFGYSPVLSGDAASIDLAGSGLLQMGNYASFVAPGYAYTTHYFALESLVYSPQTTAAREGAPRSIGELTAEQIANGLFLAGVNAGGGDAVDGSPGARGTWAVDEQNIEAYFQVNFAGQAGSLPFDANLGARYLNIDTQSYASALDKSQSLDNSYSDFLPSASVNFYPAEDWVVRLGAARVIARTPLDDLRAGATIGALNGLTIVNETDAVPVVFGGNGNPKLDPFAANQFDISLEWYFTDEALAAVAYYYKDVDTYIGYAANTTTFVDTPVLVTSTGETVLRDVTVSNNAPVNGEGGYIQGVEVTFKTPFSFLPGELGNLGFNGTTAFADTNLAELTPVTNPFALGGLAKITANAELWYSAHGIDALFGWSHHSPFTVVTAWESSQINRLQAEDFLYFSVSYRVTDNVSLRAQGNNLTNQPWIVNRASNDPNSLYRNDNFGRTFNFDVTVTF